MSVESFTLLDKTTIPWLAWGNGSGKARASPTQSGIHALNSGITHIDTAQCYYGAGGKNGDNELTVKDVLQQWGKPKSSVYITTKISEDQGKPVPVDEIEASVRGSIARLGATPNLILIHNPYVTAPTATTDAIRAFWHKLEELKAPGGILEDVSLGVSNFRPQDLNAILDDEQTKFKPVINQIEYHPYVLSHVQPILDIQAKHGIRTAAFGPLTPVLRHPTGGPLKPILTRIAERIKKDHSADVDEKAVLLLWTRAQGVVTVTASGNPDNITRLAEIARLPSGLLKKEEVEEIANVGKTIHYRYYDEHLEDAFPVPNLPNGTPDGSDIRANRPR